MNEIKLNHLLWWESESCFGIWPKIFINVPWWYLAFNRMISPFLTQRTKSKFVFAGPSKSAETLFK